MVMSANDLVMSANDLVMSANNLVMSANDLAISANDLLQLSGATPWSGLDGPQPAGLGDGGARLLKSSRVSAL